MSERTPAALKVSSQWHSSDLRLDRGGENEFGMAAPRPPQQQQVICRPGSNPVGPRCASAAGRMMPWERPRPRPEGQFNSCETLREGIPPSGLNLSQVCMYRAHFFCYYTLDNESTPLCLSSGLHRKQE